MEKEIASSQGNNTSTQVNMLQNESQQNHITEPVASAEEGKYNENINKISLTTTVEKEHASSEADTYLYSTAVLVFTVMRELLILILIY